MGTALERARDFETQFNSWFSSSLSDLIDKSEKSYRMVLDDAEEREERGLSALPSTLSVEVVDKAKESALLLYHKDDKSLGYSARDPQNTEAQMGAHWLTEVFRYKLQSQHCFPFFTWHESSLKAGYVDGLEAAFVYWKKEGYKETKTVYRDNLRKVEISKQQYDSAMIGWDEMVANDPMIPPFDIAFSIDEVENYILNYNTWWIDQLRPGINVLWDFKAPMLNVNLGKIGMLKLDKSVDEIMNYVELGVFKKVKREEVEKYQTLNSTAGNTPSDRSSLDKAKDTVTLDDGDTVKLWILFEKIGFRWMCSFSIEGQLELSKERLPVDDVFYNKRRVNVLPFVIGYNDKHLHDNIPRSIPQVIEPIEKQYIDHINNVNDIAKNIARGGRIRLNPDHNVNVDDVLNGGIFKAEQGEVEFIQYNPGVMEGLRAADMHTSAIHGVAPVGVSPVNIAPKGTNKTLGVSQMIQAVTDSKRFVQLMVRNETFLKPVMWLIAQLEFAWEDDQMALKVAAQNVKLTDQEGQQQGFNPPKLLDGNGNPIIDISKFDFDIEVKINAGLGEMPDVDNFNNLMQFKEFLGQCGIQGDGMEFARLGAALTGYQLQQFNPKPAKKPPELTDKLVVSVDWIDLPEEIQQGLVAKWMTGQISTDTKLEGRLNEIMHNKGVKPPGPQPDMTRGPQAAAMSRGGQIGGQGGY